MKSSDVISIATSYLGKTETPNNSGFKDSVFQKKMQEVGWVKGYAWCSYFCELVYKEASCERTVTTLLAKLFSGSATATFKNFDLDKTFKTGKEPKIGALVIFRYGNGWQGHAAIVTEVVDKNTIRTIEGNTNNLGSREGIVVAKKTRLINKPFTSTGLNFVGFVYLSE